MSSVQGLLYLHPNKGPHHCFLLATQNIIKNHKCDYMLFVGYLPESFFEKKERTLKIPVVASVHNYVGTVSMYLETGAFVKTRGTWYKVRTPLRGSQWLNIFSPLVLLQLLFKERP